jgi:hypothetical protein
MIQQTTTPSQKYITKIITDDVNDSKDNLVILIKEG